jgi:hypothetical protein
MDQQIYNFLINRTNETVMNEYIYPYAYQCIPKELSRDIRSFHSDINLLDCMYTYYHRPSILYTDLMYYLNNTHQQKQPTMPAFFYIIRRFHSNRVLTDKEVSELFYKLSYYGKDDNILCNRIRMIIGMLSPEERSDFINRYVLS